MSHLFEYRNVLYPDYLKRGNAMQFIAPTALQFCKGIGVDIGCGKWPLPGATPFELTEWKKSGWAALPGTDPWDFAFSSHCLEHLTNPVEAIEYWKRCIKPGGVLFLYLPHPDMQYWRPQNCRKHLHLFWPKDVAEMLRDLGFVDVIHGERDLAWSFAVVGFNGKAPDALDD